MRILIAFSFLLLSAATLAQTPESYRHWDPLSRTGKRMLSIRGEHAHIRPLSPFLEADAIAQTPDSLLNDSTGFNYMPRLVADISGGASIYPSPGASGYGGLGFAIHSTIRNRFYAQAGYQLHYLYFPDHLQVFANQRGIIPGVGESFKIGEMHAAHYYTGSVGVRMGDHFTFDAGRDKHFWGNGYRSMILSHNAAPMWYGKLTTKVWKLKYVNLWSALDAAPLDPLNPGWRRSFLTSHALSWNISPRWNLTFYESVVWQAQDTLSERGFDASYLNPFIFYRPVEFSQGSADNVLLGMELSFEATDKAEFYGQLYFDEFLLYELRRREGWWGNKYGLQLGAKAHDLFVDSLSMQTELNVVKPFTYTHGSVAQAYGTSYQSLAHPLGTNFVEWITRAAYERPNSTLRGTLIIAGYGDDQEGLNYGGDVFTSYANPWRQFGNSLMQGEKNTLIYLHAELSKPLPFLDLHAFTAGHLRKVNNSLNAPFDTWIQVGIRSSLVSPYRDF